MKTKGAIAWGAPGEWSVEEIEVGDPRSGEVTVELAASGLCHSDYHLVEAPSSTMYPLLGGHEGAGVVTKVGPGVANLAEGDHVVTAFIPACGQCVPCSSGHQNLCDLGAGLLAGRSISDGSFRVQARGENVAPMCLLGTFSPYITVNQASVVKIDESVPLNVAALVGCGVTTGWGSATRVADVQPGEDVVVIGTGGVGINAVQGAAAAGAKRVFAVDPAPFKREMALSLGATHACASVQEAFGLVQELTWGQMAHKVIVAKGTLLGEDIDPALALTGKAGRTVLVAVAKSGQIPTSIDLSMLTLMQKTLQGAIFGGCNPRADIPLLLSLYQTGGLKLDELVTNTYRLEDINQGYADMLDGKNVRGIITYGSDDR